MPELTQIRAATVVVLGNKSVIADLVFQRLNQRDSPVSPETIIQVERASTANGIIAGSPDLVVLVTDVPDQAFENTAIEKCRQATVKILPVFGRGSTVLVGPLEVAGRLGCTNCMQMRWDHSIRRRVLNEALKRQFGDPAYARTSLTFNRGELGTLAEVVVEEVAAILGGKSVHTDCMVGQFKRNKPLEWVHLVPSHTCPRCTSLPEDTPDEARISFHSHFIQDTNALRVKELDLNDIESLYVHPELGYISATQDLYNDEYIRSSAEIHIPGEPTTHVGYGSGFSVHEAKKKAILEVLERVCAIRATNRRPKVFGSYSQLRDIAINPLDFGLHDDEMYKTANCFTPFKEDQDCSWIWAYSTRADKPILIPEQIGHYGRTSDETRFVKESSSGCALGGTLEEAILFGIFEVLERDGFLNMWYGKLPVPELLVGKDCPVGIQQSLQRFSVEGYKVRLFNISHDMAIPAVFAVAIGGAEDVPRVVCGSSCHLNPYEAVEGALRELMVQVLHLKGISGARLDEGRAMLKDPSKITHILDHVVAAGMPEAFPRWWFLLEGTGSQPPKNVEEAFAGARSRFKVDSRDIRIILTSVLQEIHDKGFEVLVVKQTNIEAAYGGLHVAKVIIPGMTPITFGHGNRRVRGLTRVFELPYRLGYSRVLGLEDLNEDPHPFA